ncbi:MULTISPECIES: oligosaccharide flippase family protein [unclassified Flavobacterium]|uniref:oligosaccharide flippase family protein n=1 Tax=unclassified Flavobacterium TaxID=196869 RepID=UPI000EB3D354|nr:MULTISPECIES: oligosaccharide flippase family protein [unclassified Flavobacterium]RKS01091.1 O-antigen/teichoic acid export membrane protein [Flavobacterium sp. 102]
MLKFLKTYISNHKPLSNLITYGFGQGFNLITPLLVIPYIVSICGEEGYGKIGVGMALAFFIMVFVDYGSEIVGVKEVAINRENQPELERIFVVTYLTKLILLIAMLVLVSIIFYFFPYFNQEKTLFFFSLSMVVGQYINPTWFLQGIENFKWITILNILSKVIYLIGVFLFINKAEDYVYSNLLWGIGMIIAYGITWFYIVFHHSFSFSNVKKTEVIQMIKENFSIFSSQIFVSLQMYSPIVLISFFGGNVMAGQYKIIDQIIVIFKTYILLFFNFVYPRVCYLLEKSTEEALRFWKLYNGLNLLFIVVSMIGIMFFSVEIVSYFNPKEITSISNLLKIATIIPILQSITIPMKQLVLGSNKQSEYVKFTMIITIISLIIIVLITPIYHVLGVLIALIATEIITSFIFFKTIKNSLFLRTS